MAFMRSCDIFSTSVQVAVIMISIVPGTEQDPDTIASFLCFTALLTPSHSAGLVHWHRQVFGWLAGTLARKRMYE